MKYMRLLVCKFMQQKMLVRHQIKMKLNSIHKTLEVPSNLSKKNISS